MDRRRRRADWHSYAFIVGVYLISQDNGPASEVAALQEPLKGLNRNFLPWKLVFVADETQR